MVVAPLRGSIAYGGMLDSRARRPRPHGLGWDLRAALRLKTWRLNASRFCAGRDPVGVILVAMDPQAGRARQGKAAPIEKSGALGGLDSTTERRIQAISESRLLRAQEELTSQ